ncbi:MAG: dihydrofolate reductase [Bacteroidota bacterium]
MKDRISLIAALSLNNVIGHKGHLPWRLPADHEYFWRTAGGKAFIMGRGSFEVDEPLLSDYKNIILTSQPDRIPSSDTVSTAQNLKEAIDHLREEPEIFILGGGKVFREAIRVADRMYLSIVEAVVEGDAYFPEPNWTEWHLVLSHRYAPDANNSLAFSANVYDRKRRP